MGDPYTFVDGMYACLLWEGGRRAYPCIMEPAHRRVFACTAKFPSDCPLSPRLPCTFLVEGFCVLVVIRCDHSLSISGASCAHYLLRPVLARSTQYHSRSPLLRVLAPSPTCPELDLSPPYRALALLFWVLRSLSSEMA